MVVVVVVVCISGGKMRSVFLTARHTLAPPKQLSIVHTHTHIRPALTYIYICTIFDDPEPLVMCLVEANLLFVDFASVTRKALTFSLPSACFFLSISLPFFSRLLSQKEKEEKKGKKKETNSLRW